MPNSPKQNEQKLRQVLNAWRTLASNKSFGGMTLDQFETRIQPSFDTREEVDRREDLLAQAITARENADETSMDVVQLFVNGVIGDPTEGPDSALYEAAGYTRKSQRKTGLTRKKQTPKKE